MKDLENSGKPISISPAAVMVPDPRHNHAPDNWYSESADMTEDRWLESNLIGVDVNGNPNMPRDGDIFMATSDAGYLQSIYELAFLPRLTDLYSHGDSKTSGNYGLAGVAFKNWNDDNYATEAKDTFNAEFMWRTYDPISEDRKAFEVENLPFTSEGTGMKVNPYSDSTNVLMAAFANTPVDWRHAHTNYAFSAELDDVAKDVAAFNEMYAWNGYEGKEDAKFAWEDLRRVAGRLMDLMHGSNNPDWKTAWNNLDWYNLCSDGNVFPGVPMADPKKTDELWDVDRKFLYGFWRDCFAARQQLFLVFVRAEPMMLGGGAANQLPPQLGARAVALVWRDPATPAAATDGYPHRTRILFYRPLD